MIARLKGSISSKPAAVETEGRVRDIVWYSGAAVERYDFWNDEEYLLQFSMDKDACRLKCLNDGAPILLDHMPTVDNTVGRFVSARIEDGKGVGTVKFSDTPDVDILWQKIENGTLTDVSMGVWIHQMKDVTKKGGKKHLMAIDWEPRETSVVSIGADPGAGFLSTGSRNEFMVMLASRGVTLPQVLSETGAAGQAEVPDYKVRARVLELSNRLRGRMMA